jgi:hypothetical protein
MNYLNDSSNRFNFEISRVIILCMMITVHVSAQSYANLWFILSNGLLFQSSNFRLKIKEQKLEAKI